MKGMGQKTPAYREELAQFVRQEYERRREERRSLETKWLLNLNYMLGNQCVATTPAGEVVQCERRYHWQQSGVYNHIAPLIETRLSKFVRVNCGVNVRPASGSEQDVNIAKLATKLIESTQTDNDFVSLQNTANYWSEVTGTAFYKVTWEDEKGVVLEALSPYELYPESLAIPELSAQPSLIHARAYPVGTIRERYGVEVSPQQVDCLQAGPEGGQGGGRARLCALQGHALVLEYYALPTKEHPEGQLIIVAGDKAVYQGDLPYRNGPNGTRTFPFVRQVAFPHPACLFGVSLIERLIPIQRAYNAVKNRKHELMNRLSAGVTAVEEGSVDVDKLEDEGLAPGTVLVYRQGTTPPVPLPAGVVPSELRDEEDRLLTEFQQVAGASNLLSSDVVNANISGYALSLLIEQDYTRLSVSTEGIRRAVKEIAKQTLRLYRCHGKGVRMLKISGENGESEVVSFLASDLNSDDVIAEPDSEMVETPATRRNMVLDLLKLGILGDENGKLSNRNKAKVMELLGFGNWESARSSDEIHIKKAQMEHAGLSAGKPLEADETDAHALHIEEHALYLASHFQELSDAGKAAIEAHVRSHKILARLTRLSEEEG